MWSVMRNEKLASASCGTEFLFLIYWHVMCIFLQQYLLVQKPLYLFQRSSECLETQPNLGLGTQNSFFNIKDQMHTVIRI